MALSERLTQQRRALTKLWLAYGKPAMVAFAILIVLVGVLAGYNTWQRSQREAAARELADSGSKAAEAVAGAMGKLLGPIDAALDMPSLAANAQADNRQAVAQSADVLVGKVPGLLGIRLLRESDAAPDYDSVPPVTYAALAMLREAKASASDPLPEILLAGKPQEHVAVLKRIVDAKGEVQGHLLLGFDTQAIKRSLKDAGLPPGAYLELSQAESKGQAAIVAVGKAVSRVGVATFQRNVPGTRLIVTLWPQASDAVGGASTAMPMLAGAVALLAIGVGAALWWRRRQSQASAEVLEAPGALAAAARASDRASQVDELSANQPLPTVEVEEAKVAFGVSVDELDPTIFRAYDIRGVVGEGLTEDVVRLIGLAIGSEAFDRGQQTVVIGADGRASSPVLAGALIEGLRQSGRDVIDIGRVPTPVLYFATHFLETGSGVMITGSHNPPQYNGLKIMIGGETLFGDDIQALKERVIANDFSSGSGNLQQMDVAADYIRRVCEDVPVALGNAFRIVVDCGNGIAGDFAPKLLRALGHDVVELFCDVDGNFPNHHPDPSQPENLQDLIRVIEEEGADLGFAFDGDGDRLGVVDGEGHIIWPDSQMMLYARDVLSRNAGAEIVFDVKCSSRLAKVITRLGGKPVMFKTGHSFIKNKLKETGAPLAGEMSGHIFFKERWYGFDDALYTAARLVEILMAVQSSPSEVFAKLPTGVSTPELRLDMAEGENLAFMEALGDASSFGDGKLTTIDGVRVDWDDCWGLVRASNTTPSLVLRFEGDTPEALERVKGIFRDVLLAKNPRLELPF